MASHAAQRARVLAPKKRPVVYTNPMGTTWLIPMVDPDQKALPTAADEAVNNPK